MGRAWQIANPEKDKENKRKWNQEHPGYNKKYQEEHAIHLRERRKQWEARNEKHLQKYQAEYRKNHKIERLTYIRNYQEKNRERILEAARKYRHRHPEVAKQCHLSYYARFPERYQANRIIHHFTNKLRDSYCSSCGSRQHLHFHHPDYSRPTFGVTLCAKCHVQLHRNLRKISF